MNSIKRYVQLVLCLLLGLTGGLAQGRDDVLSAIPADSLGFAVVHNVSAASHDISELAKLVQAPAPDLLSLAKGMTGLQKGIDEEGDLAIVVTTVDSAPKKMILAPVANFEDLYAALKIQDPGTGVADVLIAGAPALLGKKGSYAVIASANERDGLEKLLASTASLASDKALADWVAANRASVVVRPEGLKLLLPKATEQIRAMQAQMRQVGGENGKNTADAMGMYVSLFSAAEKEVEQFSVGLRIDATQTVDLVSRAELKTTGKWTEWAAKAKPAEEDLLGGLEAKPFVMAMGGTVPQEVMKEFMKMSVNFMQNQPQFKLTPEQAAKYADLSTKVMAGVKSMRFLMGVPQPGAGVYGNTSMVMTVDDSKGYLDAYENSLTEMRKLAEEAKNSLMPVATTKRMKIGDTEGLEVSMTLPHLKALAQPGGPDPEKMMKLFLGEDGTLKYYVAPADEHAVVLAYISPDRLKEAIEFYRSKQPGLSNDPAVAKVADKMPAGAQVVAYVSLGGIMQIAKQVAASTNEGHAAAIPDFPDGPPFGMAAKVSASAVEGHWIITADTLRGIGDTVAKARAAARERQLQPPQ